MVVRMKEVKCLALDVDGTITEEGHYVNSEVPFLLRMLERMGIRVIFVSGRSIWELYTLASIFGTTRVGVGENGGAVVYKNPVDVCLLADVSESLRAFDRLSKRMPEVRIRRTFPRLTEVVLERTIDVAKANQVLKEEGLRAKVVDSGFALHIVHEDVDKGKGMLKACELLGIKGEEVIAIGDSDTDVDMFDSAGFSIAVGNATELAKKRADLTVDEPRGRGVIKAVSYIFEKLM
jgi:hypothetical protein